MRPLQQKLFKVIMREKQLPLSANRWQHGSQIFFATFLVKNHKIVKTQEPRKLDKISTDLESVEF
jgi:hypothetical protein